MKTTYQLLQSFEKQRLAKKVPWSKLLEETKTSTRSKWLWDKRKAEPSAEKLAQLWDALGRVKGGETMGRRKGK